MIKIEISSSEKEFVQDLKNELPNETRTIEIKNSFDGQMFTQIIVQLTVSSIPILAKFLMNRINCHKVVIKHNNDEITLYIKNLKELDNLIAYLSKYKD